ncbi:MAG: DNA recombination protein RmuC [Candidatus Nomurabacteria bacterium]|jgi:DNA recombination protein RmuC|nr:DNA recombination protein RmuC [Candidatus Nomurabacteria bacterium]
METILIIFAGLIVVGLVVLIILQLRGRSSGESESGYLKQDLIELTRGVNGLNEKMTENLQRSNESLHKQFAASQKLVRDITERMTKFEETNKNVLNATDKLEDLQNILLNPKHRGNFGEFQLNSVLENFFPPNQWQSQYKFENGEAVDAVLFLKDKKMLPIDSKFSLENYNRMTKEKNPEKKKALLKEVYKDLKSRVDETSKYIRPSEDTMDFAFMFIPSEALYYDLLVGATGGEQKDLIEYAHRDKKVIIVSPTTFVAYLQTVLQGLRSLQIEEQAKEIQKRVGQLGAHIQKYDSCMQKIGNSLGTTVNHFNSAHKELKKIDKDVVKIAGGEEAVDPLQLDAPVKDE